MTKHPTVKSRDLTGTQPFLMPWPPMVTQTDPLPEAQDSTCTDEWQDAMASVFPDRPFGETFIETAAAATASAKQFAAIAVRMDPVCQETNGPLVPDDKPLEVARVVSTVLEARGGIWGFLEAHVIGCVFSDYGVDDAEAVVAVIQESLTRLEAGTVTTGITEFPFHPFTREETICNARKAVDHATFFGPGSSARFDAVSLNVSGDILYQSGHTEKAMAEFETALTLDPQNANVLNSLGVCHGIREAYDKALDAFEAAMAADPDEAIAPYNAGLVHLLKNDPETALSYFEKAAPRGVDVFEIQFETGKLLTELNQDTRALSYLLKAIELQSESAPANRLIGDIYERRGQTEAAVEMYKKAVRLNPNDAASLSALGTLYAGRGENIDICITFCRQSVEIDPESGLYRKRLGELLRKAGMDAEALEQFRKARELGEDCEDSIEALEQQPAAKAAS